MKAGDRGILLAVLFILLVLPAPRSPAVASTGGGTGLPNLRLDAGEVDPVAQAVQIADEHIRREVEAGSIPQWAGCRAGEPLPHYGLDGQVSAHIIPVLKDNSDSGYIVVAALAEGPQVVEYSTSPTPYYSFLEVAQKVADGWGLALDSGHPLYLGHFGQYLVVVSQADLLAMPRGQQPLYRILLHVPDLQFVILGRDNRPLSALPDGTVLAIPAALRHGCREPGPVVYTPSHPRLGPAAYKELVVPFYLQFCYGTCFVGCSPTAGGTLMGYWADRGFANLVIGGSGGDYQGTISRLSELAGTWCCSAGTVCGDPGWGCTYWSAETDAMLLFTQERGYVGGAAFGSSHIVSPGFDQYMTEIDQDRPMVVNFNGYSGGIFPYADHATTGVGYDTASGEYMIVSVNMEEYPWPVYVLYGWGYSGLSINTLVPPADVVPPTTEAALSGTAGDNGWFVSNAQVTLSATDNPGGSGVKQVRYRIDGGGWQVYSAAFTIASDGRHTLEYYAEDNAGNQETHHDTSVSIDATAPTGTLLLERGASTTYATLVRAGLTAADATSGVQQVRLRDAGGSWEAWQSFQPSVYWLLPALSRQTLGVELQISDYAGNESAVYADDIYLDLHPARPGSTSYLLSKSTLGVSSGLKSSASYALGGTGAQPSGVSEMSSSSYNLALGYWRMGGLGGEEWRVYLPLVTR